MSDPLTQRYFDTTGRVRRPSYGQLASEVGALLLDHPAPPDSRDLPSGERHVVLVIPAFLTGDWPTSAFRRFLCRCQFRAEGWGLGINWGPTPEILAGLHRRLSELREMEQGPVSLIGISLGGLLARDLAQSRPQDVRRVITMASPWPLPTASTIEPVVQIAARYYSADIDLERLRRPLPMPATSIYTRDDGIVAWQSCRDDDVAGETSEGIEVQGAHSTIARNPQAMAAVVRLLAEDGGGGRGI